MVERKKVSHDQYFRPFRENNTSVFYNCNIYRTLASYNNMGTNQFCTLTGQKG
jgi:hypothetical protein